LCSNDLLSKTGVPPETSYKLTIKRFLSIVLVSCIGKSLLR
jgi:hypothetical protein